MFTTRKYKLGVIFSCIIFFCSILPGVSQSETEAGKEYVIGPEDVLQIKVWGNDDLNREVEVSQEGAFTFPLIDKVQAAGLSIFELEKMMKEKLSEGFFVRPQVTVTVTKYKSRKAILLGEVKKPGSYVIKGKTNILELISEAGGLTEEAGRTVTIVRQSKNKNIASNGNDNSSAGTVTINLDLDRISEGSADESFFAFNGDSIYINKVQRIYITGEVNKPGEFKWDKGLTVHHAIALAGGPTKRGAPNRTKIIRAENGKETEIKPDMSDAVLPNDIVKVPQSYF